MITFTVEILVLLMAQIMDVMMTVQKIIIFHVALIQSSEFKIFTIVIANQVLIQVVGLISVIQKVINFAFLF
jgi:hypothetical protein